MRRRHLLALPALVAVAGLVRWWWVQGLVLGDDPQEFGALRHVLASGPDLRDQLQLRFGGWLPNYVAAVLFGLSETTVLLPAWLVSSSFAALAYVLLVRWRYGAVRSFAGALLVATAPFEVVLGTCRTNDLYLAGALGVGFVLLVLLEERPILQGLSLALALWYGFYVKLWAVYALPGFALYVVGGRRWRTALAFAAASVVLHGATMLNWKLRLGTFVPFVTTHAANYPVKTLAGLGREWTRYPAMLFVGSELHTTLFGIVPWLLLALLLPRLVRRRLDRPDRLLLGFWGSIFLLLELFPAGFRLDAYYTVPRIFRYLAPISFPLTLHTAKLVLDTTRAWRPGWTASAMAALLAANLLGAMDATLPGRSYRRALHAVIDEIERGVPPRVVAEITLGYWLNALYLDPELVETEVVTPPQLYAPTACEQWIRKSAAGWPAGTWLVTGLVNYVHYGALRESLLLGWFDRPLDDRWTLVGEYGVLSYLPRPEAARIWRLARGAPRVASPHERDDPPPPGALAPAARFSAAMERFEAGDRRAARAHFRVLMAGSGPVAEDATFYYAASFFRDESWERARHEFKRMIARYPRGRWIPTAHWHIGITELRQGRVRRARARFAYVARAFPQDPVTVQNARAELKRLSRRDGLVVDLWRRLTGHGSG